ncbi:MAG: alcohol dehydrogenase catalytic domain-containing protein, partial [Conexivisphaerales archaeon]
MKAMVLESVNTALVEREIELPDPAEDEAIVRIRANGVCATDVKISEGLGPKAKLPVVLGHEPAGEVVRCRRTDEVKVGQRVVIHPHIYCGRCQNCIDGMENICLNIRGSLGMTINGGLAEYAICP